MIAQLLERFPSGLAQRALLGRFTLLVLACASDHECPEVGATWCSGSEIVTCEEGSSDVPAFGGENNVVRHVFDCAVEGTGCVEDHGEPNCGFPDRTCFSASNLCIGNKRVSCGKAGEHPVVAQNCDLLGESCVAGVQGQTGCSEFAESCDPASGEVRCRSARPFTCQRGIWELAVGLPTGTCTTSAAVDAGTSAAVDAGTSAPVDAGGNAPMDAGS